MAAVSKLHVDLRIQDRDGTNTGNRYGTPQLDADLLGKKNIIWYGIMSTFFLFASVRVYVKERLDTPQVSDFGGASYFSFVDLRCRLWL